MVRARIRVRVRVWIRVRGRGCRGNRGGIPGTEPETRDSDTKPKMPGGP